MGEAVSGGNGVLRDCRHAVAIGMSSGMVDLGDRDDRFWGGVAESGTWGHGIQEIGFR
jgi:hypothetical protein